MAIERKFCPFNSNNEWNSLISIFLYDVRSFTRHFFRKFYTEIDSIERIEFMRRERERERKFNETIVFKYRIDKLENDAFIYIESNIVYLSCIYHLVKYTLACETLSFWNIEAKSNKAEIKFFARFICFKNKYELILWLFLTGEKLSPVITQLNARSCETAYRL